MRNLDAVVQAYIECAVWADKPEDCNVTRVSDAMKKSAREDCEDFIALLDREKVDSSMWDDAQFGHDFWLTRNHHGAGFWDRGYEAGDELTRWAHTYGERYVYVGAGSVLCTD